MTVAARSRLYRRRRRAGRIVVGLEVTPELTEALLIAGRLNDREVEYRRHVAAAAADVLRDWAARWLRQNQGN